MDQRGAGETLRQVECGRAPPGTGGEQTWDGKLFWELGLCAPAGHTVLLARRSPARDGCHAPLCAVRPRAPVPAGRLQSRVPGRRGAPRVRRLLPWGGGRPAEAVTTLPAGPGRGRTAGAPEVGRWAPRRGVTSFLPRVPHSDGGGGRSRDLDSGFPPGPHASLLCAPCRFAAVG